MHKPFLFIFLLLYALVSLAQAPFNVVVKKTGRYNDSIKVSFRDVLSQVEDSTILFTYTVDKRGNVLDSAITLLANGIANCKYNALPDYEKEFNISVQIKLNNQLALSANYRLIGSIDAIEKKCIPLVENPTKELFSFFPESGRLMSGFSQKVKLLPNFPANNFTGKVIIYDQEGNKLSQFNFSEQQQLQLTMPDTGAIFCVLNDSLKMEIKGSKLGYAFMVNQLADSIQIKVYRGIQEPFQQLELWLTTDSVSYLLLNPIIDDDVFILSTTIHKQLLDNKPYSLILRNQKKQIVAQRNIPVSTKQEVDYSYINLTNEKLIIADATFSRTFRFTSKVKKPMISYQVVDEAGELVNLGSVEWISDTLFRINELQVFGNGAITFNIPKSELYGNDFSITADASNDYSSLKEFYVANKKQTPLFPQNETLQENEIQAKGNFTLANVTVKTVIKKRIDELEEKYVNSYLFKQLFERRINVLDDEQSRNGMHIFDYIAMRYPRMVVTNKQVKFPIPKIVKSLGVDYYVDEVYTDEEVAGSIPVFDVAYIKILKQPIRGFGSLSAVAIYTRKGNETEPNPYVKYQLPIIGIQK